MRTVDMTDVTDYSDPRNWVYYGYGEDRRADVFLIAPTVDFADEFNMPVDDRDQRNFFRISLEMEKGIYEDVGSLYAPYYRQCSMKAYSLDPAERERYLQIAYLDVRSAFEYYLDRAPSVGENLKSRSYLLNHIENVYGGSYLSMKRARREPLKAITRHQKSR